MSHVSNASSIWSRVVAAALAAAMAGVVLVAYAQLEPEIFHRATYDFWFESDPPAVFTDYSRG